MGYKVTVAADYMDPKAEEFFFDEFNDAQDFVYETASKAVDFRVQHSPYTVSEKELDDMFEEEMQLIRIESV